ncbi:MAG: transcriptional repressor LexA [Candidatus Auribacter fodinae]|jgi:repressor LexA|uniref:LexA repressor n=1 Tax=Candidatus Auribacter fodinae TaxID=2093366 RepID=A0A3A4R0K7_9BACT|nr:MAG: transcriptional repressor LexA [Candidatus Auribacter fodinae]
MKKTLTGRQREILDFIAAHAEEAGYAPSLQEIAAHFRFTSITTVVNHLNALERKGAIQRPRGARTMTVSEKYRKKAPVQDMDGRMVMVPVIGRVAAGQPILAVEDVEDQFVMDSRLVRYGNAFLLRVKGDSMIDAHIEDGDLVLVKPQHSADNNDIVVAMVDDEATVKRYRLSSDSVELIPENPAYDVLRFPRRDCPVSIIGLVIGVFRHYR